MMFLSEIIMIIKVLYISKHMNECIVPYVSDKKPL